MEKRVKLDFYGIVTFYNPRLCSLSGSYYRSIFGYNTYQNGWGFCQGHRLLNISKVDTKTVQTWLKYATARVNIPSLKRSLYSRINWQALTEVIIDYHYSCIKEIYATL